MGEFLFDLGKRSLSNCNSQSRQNEIDQYMWLHKDIKIFAQQKHHVYKVKRQPTHREKCV